MAAFMGGPYAAQNHQHVKEMVQSLQSHTKNKSSRKGRDGPVSVKKGTYVIGNNRTVDSWKMRDWDYKQPNLPTYARGLFTIKTRDGKDEIAIRGYDKFFNNGEVRNTEWHNVEKNTRGPYELSVKENGCIIFMSGLDDGQLLVCSKHSTGQGTNTGPNHSAMGERWAERHMNAIGKTKTDLALKLRDMNVTAVAELCDDQFEEHVLTYAPESAGLYLHGLNLNLPEFATYPADLVNKFADEWGFRQTQFLTKDTIIDVKDFLDECAETGSYNGRDTEGFVIRCQTRESKDTKYRDWFFKYKFDEPYLMYRQWRECTKAVIAGKAPLFKKHRQITEQYLIFARKKLAENPKLAKEYNMNHGIIKLRDDFLAEKGVRGADIIRNEIESGAEVDARHLKRDLVLVPIATLGCGKTTIALALSKLFGWGHLQNDNVEGRKGRPQKFASMLCSNMVAHPVVVADRNNHQKREREQLINDVSRGIPSARFVALHYVHDPENMPMIRKSLQKRVLDRGDNHQTIQAASKGEGEILGIMEGFWDRFQPVDISNEPDSWFDIVIDLQPTASSRENLEIVINRLQSKYSALFDGQTMPTANDLDDAIEAALSEYRPDFKQDLSRKAPTGRALDKKQQQLDRRRQREQKRNGPSDYDPSSFSTTMVDDTANGEDVQSISVQPPQVEYFAVRLEATQILRVLDALFRDQPESTSAFIRQLQQSRRVQDAFHVTLIHKSSRNTHPQVWEPLHERLLDRYQEEAQKLVEGGAPGLSLNPKNMSEPELGTCDIRLERLVWDDRVMSFVARIVGGQDDGEIDFRTTNEIAHVTVGTARKDIKPRESNDLLQRWLGSGRGEGSGIQDLMVTGQVVLQGSVRGILSRF